LGSPRSDWMDTRTDFTLYAGDHFSCGGGGRGSGSGRGGPPRLRGTVPGGRPLGRCSPKEGRFPVKIIKMGPNRARSPAPIPLALCGGGPCRGHPRPAGHPTPTTHLEDIQADVAVLVHVGVEAGRLEPDDGRPERVVAPELEGEPVPVPLVRCPLRALDRPHPLQYAVPRREGRNPLLSGRLRWEKGDNTGCQRRWARDRRAQLSHPLGQLQGLAGVPWAVILRHEGVRGGAGGSHGGKIAQCLICRVRSP